MWRWFLSYVFVVSFFVVCFADVAFGAGNGPTKVAVVYDATSDLVDEIIVPDNDAELTTSLTQTLAIPNGVQVNVPISSINVVGFAAALAIVAPAAILPAPGATNAIVLNLIASNQ